MSKWKFFTFRVRSRLVATFNEYRTISGGQIGGSIAYAEAIGLELESDWAGYSIPCDHKSYNVIPFHLLA